MRKLLRSGGIRRSCRMSVGMVLAAFVAGLLAATAAFPAAAAARPADWSDVMVRQVDRDGYNIALRKGDENLGYRHYADRHNLHSTAAIQLTLRGTLDVDQGAHREYINDFKDADAGGRVIVRVRVVVHLGSQTEDREYAVYDDYIGVITAFCEGMQRCPDKIDRLRF